MKRSTNRILTPPHSGLPYAGAPAAAAKQGPWLKASGSIVSLAGTTVSINHVGSRNNACPLTSQENPNATTAIASSQNTGLMA